MFETAKAGQVVQEIEWYICKLDILGIWASVHGEEVENSN